MSLSQDKADSWRLWHDESPQNYLSISPISYEINAHWLAQCFLSASREISPQNHLSSKLFHQGIPPGSFSLYVLCESKFPCLPRRLWGNWVNWTLAHLRKDQRLYILALKKLIGLQFLKKSTIILTKLFVKRKSQTQSSIRALYKFCWAAFPSKHKNAMH